MALTAYIAAVNRLLQNPLPTVPLYSTGDLTVYINTARQQLAGEAECIRATSVAALTAAQQEYGFSLFTTFGYDAVASGSIAFSTNPSAGDTITLNGVVFTFVNDSSGWPNSATNYKIDIAANAGGTIFFLIQALTSSATYLANTSLNVASYSDTGGGSTDTLIINYKTAGAAGNAYTLAASVATPSGPHLTGGQVLLSGIQGVLTIRQMRVLVGSNYQAVYNQPWSWFQRYYLSPGAAIAQGTPGIWSQQGRGVAGTFAVSPVPSTGATISIDAVLLPEVLSDDSTPEAIPYPWTDAIPYYAAYMAYLSSQKTQDATVMLGRYKEFVRRGTQFTTPTVLPVDHPGGLGAQGASAKVPLSTQAQAAQGGR